MKKFTRPNFKVRKSDIKNNYGCFVIEPLERGFANTLGNCLRRVLLSSTPGAAIYGVKIKGVNHEFSTISGVVENSAQIVLNLKEVVLRINNDINTDEKVILKVEATEGILTAGMIQCPSGVEILNPDHYLATIAEDGKLVMTMYARNYRGYHSFNDNKNLVSIGEIPIDSNYSPILKVSYKVEPTKVGKSADLEQLIFEVTTDESVTPTDALSIAAKIISEHLSYFVDLSDKAQNLEVISTLEKQETDELDKPIDDLDLSVRPYNCLRQANFRIIRDLTEKTEEEIRSLRNLGEKSFTEIKNKLASWGLTFRKD